MSENEDKNEEFELRQFMRNKYFYGKLMTVTDFELEQEYFNRKRYLLNRLIYGKGLLCGFRHFKVLTENSSEEVSIIFKDGGVAFDSLGQEIVVPKNVEKKILVKSDKSFNKNDFRDITYLYLKYSPRYSSLASEHVTLASNSQDSLNGCPRILEDFEVIASVNYPEEEKNEMRSCTADARTDTKVFFVAVKKDSKGELSIDEVESSLWRYYLKDHIGSSTRNVSATGILHFKDFNTNTITSNLIDPKLGKGPIFVQLGQETEDGIKVTTGDDGDLWEKGFSKLHLGAIIEPHSGKFRVKVVFDDDENDRKSIRVRWWAFVADKIYKAEEVDGEAEAEVIIKKFNFVSDPEVEAKIVENGLCESGVKNCMTDGKILGGDHYARIEKGLTLIKKDKALIKAYVALNGNQTKLAKLIIEQEQDEERTLMENEEWYVGGGWVLEVEDIYKELVPPTAEIKISFKEKEPKYFKVSKGSLVTYCDDIDGETGVPLFVTYVRDINIPGTDIEFNNLTLSRESNIILKYTWAISNIVELD